MFSTVAVEFVEFLRSSECSAEASSVDLQVVEYLIDYSKNSEKIKRKSRNRRPNTPTDTPTTLSGPLDDSGHSLHLEHFLSLKSFSLHLK